MNQLRLQWVHNEPAGGTATGSHGGRTRVDPMDHIDLIRSYPLFQDLGDDVLEFLAAKAHRQTFREGETIFYQGDPGSTCHLIVEGNVRVVVIGEDGRELAMRILGPGEIIGEMALFEDRPRSASVEALARTQTLELHQEALLRCLRHSPTLALRLLGALSSRLRYATEEAEGLASLTVSERLLRRLWKLAEWSGVPVEEGVRLALPMTQQELAALVGTSRESVNRALVQLRSQDRVRIDRGWIVLVEPDQRS